MNFLEALKSGKRFRREGCKFWFDTNSRGFVYYGDGETSISKVSILSDDWETEEDTELLKARIKELEDEVNRLRHANSSGTWTVSLCHLCHSYPCRGHSLC